MKATRMKDEKALFFPPSFFQSQMDVKL